MAVPYLTTSTSLIRGQDVAAAQSTSEPPSVRIAAKLRGLCGLSSSAHMFLCRWHKTVTQAEHSVAALYGWQAIGGGRHRRMYQYCR